MAIYTGCFLDKLLNERAPRVLSESMKIAIANKLIVVVIHKMKSLNSRFFILNFIVLFLSKYNLNIILSIFASLRIYAIL
jgi:hypothetical protein